MAPYISTKGKREMVIFKLKKGKSQSPANAEAVLWIKTKESSFKK